MTKIILTFALAALLILGAGYNSFAANTVNVSVTATVPSVANGIDAAISKVDAKGTCTATDDTWTAGQSSVAFGTLTWDTTNKIFLSQYYYAIDVGVVDNSGNNWTLTHTRTNFQRAGGTESLNGNVNVTFTHQTDSTTGTDLSKVSYENSNNASYTKTQLVPGWLRIYYGIATGDTRAGCTDASGVVPVGLDKPTGTYTGQVTLTLTGT